MATAIGNPLRQGLPKERKPEPSVLVIFGGSGDLAKRKLIPSLYEMETRGELPERFAVVGFAFTKRTHEEYRQLVLEAMHEFYKGAIDDAVWQRLASRLYYVASSFDGPEGYQELRDLLGHLKDQYQTQGNVIYFLSSPPSFFSPIIELLDKAGLASQDNGWKRIVIEKPFGEDLDSARELNKLVDAVFDEANVYRIDHYLGKETVQNIMVFRFANTVFEPVWNRQYIDHIEITAAETVGLEGRGDYYEEAGALRDMVQNHILQVLALVAMEPPATFEADAIRDEKAKILHSIRPIPPSEVDSFVVRGQYGPGTVDGKEVPGYRQEEGVSPNSSTETYVAAKFYIDNWRWQDVPFYIRTGKRLSKKKTDIVIQFKPVPHAIFSPTPSVRPAPNAIVIRIQPEEGISLNIETKPPGPATIPHPVDLDFRYLSAFAAVPSEAYERLLLDCMLGDQTLFARADGVEAQWAVVDPILQGWKMSPPPDFPNYAAGSWGPMEADELLARDGRRWRRL